MAEWSSVLCLFALCMTVLVPYVSTNKYASQVLLVSMDGFRWDYINKTQTPNFDRMARLGTHALYMNNTFITKTFPNHYTLVTGLRVTALRRSWVRRYPRVLLHLKGLSGKRQPSGWTSRRQDPPVPSNESTPIRGARTSLEI